MTGIQHTSSGSTCDGLPNFVQPVPENHHRPAIRRATELTAVKTSLPVVRGGFTVTRGWPSSPTATGARTSRATPPGGCPACCWLTVGAGRQVPLIAGGPSPRCWYAMPYGRQRNSSWGRRSTGSTSPAAWAPVLQVYLATECSRNPGKPDASFSIRTATPSSGLSGGYDAGLPPGERLLRR